ncbi:MAG: cytidylate kinase-like family protein [Bradymonadales bacterium]|nr:cytidylate kinase-like family protein [Bradymonadales bacterium]
MSVIKATTRSIQQILEEQIAKWQVLEKSREGKKEPKLKVITVSRQPGSGGSLIAASIGNALNLKLYHRELTAWVAERAQMDQMTVESMDEKEHSIIESWIAALTREKHLWPEEYLRHLKKIVHEIASKEGGIIVGRGANFILPEATCLSVRFIAPIEDRIANVSKLAGVQPKEAEQRILRREAHRKAFIKRYYKRDINDPTNYDLNINTKNLTLDAAVQMVSAAWHSLRQA